MDGPGSQDESDFVKRELIPEIVHDRCFCDAGSREFVEFESVAARPLVAVTRKIHRPCKIYECDVVVRFSGEPRHFHVVAKLCPESVANGGKSADSAYSSFQNEELFYSKMAGAFGPRGFAKCYASDMGRYGMPVIVLEDLRAAGYETIEQRLNDDQLLLCLRVLGEFHARGLKMKSEEYSLFREFYAKFLETRFDDESMNRYERKKEKILGPLKSLSDHTLAEKISRRLGENPLQTAKHFASEIDEDSSICHGRFSRDNLLFKHENGKPVDVKMIDWKAMRYCSPAIDLGPALFANLSAERELSKLNEMLMFYVNVVVRDRPEISAERFRKNILSKLSYAYVMLSLEEDLTEQEQVTMLLGLESLGAFD